MEPVGKRGRMSRGAQVLIAGVGLVSGILGIAGYINSKHDITQIQGSLAENSHRHDQILQGLMQLVNSADSLQARQKAVLSEPVSGTTEPGWVAAQPGANTSSAIGHTISQQRLRYLVSRRADLDRQIQLSESVLRGLYALRDSLEALGRDYPFPDALARAEPIRLKLREASGTVEQLRQERLNVQREINQIEELIKQRLESSFEVTR
jgi:hypothetical protein